MALITMPASPVPAEVDWQLEQPTQVNTSQWTGKRRVTILPAAKRWHAKVNLPLLIGEDAVLAWRVFMTVCAGQANSFLLRAVERPQTATTFSPLVNGAPQTGKQLVTDGWPADGLILKAGNLVMLASYQLLVLEQNVNVSGGAATLHFTSEMRAPPADNSAIEVRLPCARMAMASDVNGWTASRGQQYPISFECEEAIA